MKRWVQTINIRQWATKYPGMPDVSTEEGGNQFTEVRDGVASELKRLREYKDMDSLEGSTVNDFVQEMEDAVSWADYNAVLGEIYAWCDEVGVWTSG
jgi:hypothetical protein